MMVLVEGCFDVNLHLILSRLEALRPKPQPHDGGYGALGYGDPGTLNGSARMVFTPVFMRFLLMVVNFGQKGR
jgi:hypothetical protein